MLSPRLLIFGRRDVIVCVFAYGVALLSHKDQRRKQDNENATSEALECNTAWASIISCIKVSLRVAVVLRGCPLRYRIERTVHLYTGLDSKAIPTTMLFSVL